MITLRPYQEVAKAAVYQHLQERDDNPCVVIPTGGGKTPVIASICKDAVERWQGRVLVLAHVKELLEQAVDKLRDVCSHLPIGVYSAGLRRRDKRESVIVAGIQSAFRRACELDAFDLIIVDECFIQGTLVSTPTGEIPIEQIQPGMYVQNALGIGVVTAVSARSSDDLITLEYCDGSRVTCTPNHPVFTENGWRPAGALEVGSLAVSIQGLRVLWGTVSSLVKAADRRERDSAEGASLAEAAILLDFLLEDPEQLHVVGRDSPESQPNSESSRAQAEGTRGQWAFDKTADRIGTRAGNRLGDRVRNPCSRVQATTSAEEPQNRYCKPSHEDRHRTGRPQPSVSSAENARLTKDCLPGAKRLVRITHHERTSARAVFNLQVSGHPSYFANGTLVHNCHLIPPEGEGMYRQFLAEARVVNPQLRVIGFTATPFRFDSGPICTPEHFLNHVCFEVGVRELIRDGFLSPLVTKAGKAKVDATGLQVRGGEFVAEEVESLMDDACLVEAACDEMVEYAADRRTCLIFASGIKHARHIAQALERRGQECGFVCGQTPTRERDAVLKRFRRGELKYLVNVGVLTTGFDAPNVDCVTLLRPTLSPGLYYQMVGRGFRLYPGKRNCLVLDFGGNVLRHGPVDLLRVATDKRGNGGTAPAKECPNCQAVIAAGYAICPECGHAFPPPNRQRHEPKATEAGILSGQISDSDYEVHDISYSVHMKRKAAPEAPRTMRVSYRLGLNHWQSEFVCFEHKGFARQKAVIWWKQRSPDPVPATAQEAVDLANGGCFRHVESITVRNVAGEKYDRIVGYVFGEEELAAAAAGGLSDEEIPF